MGDIADMMLEGTLCEQCGTFISGGEGYPRNCGCDESAGAFVLGAKTQCPYCPKRVKIAEIAGWTGMRMRQHHVHDYKGGEERWGTVEEFMGHPPGRVSVYYCVPDYSLPENLHLLMEVAEKILPHGYALQITIERNDESNGQIHREVKIWPDREDKVQIVTGGGTLSEALMEAIEEASK